MKIKTKQNKIKSTHKDAMESILFWRASPRLGACPEVWSMCPGTRHWSTPISPIRSSSSCTWLLGYGGALCLCPLLWAGILSGLNLCGSCAWCCVHVSVRLCLEESVPFKPGLTPGSYHLPTSSLTYILVGRGLMQTSHLQLGALHCLSLGSLCSCGSLC